MQPKGARSGSPGALFSYSFFGGDSMNQSNSEQLARLNQRLKKIKGNDPISRARKEALLKAIYELQQAEVV